MSAARPAGAVRVAGGILASRVVGFLRDRAIAHWFGAGPHADVFRTALRGPNILQNLLGEGTLSAAFIPVYTRLLAAGRREEAGRFAGAVFGLLLAVAAAVSLAGVLLARPIVALLVPGFLADSGDGVDRFELAVRAVRIVFPMTGVLVLAAWALGVLNSHRRFFLPYVAPVVWNAAIIAGLWWAADRGGAADRDRLLLAACWGALVGGALQFLVQLPLVLRLLGGLRPRFTLRVEGVPEALRAFLPVVAGRGAVQLSAYLDTLLASLLAPGAVGALGWAQSLYLLPVSLFGMSVAAAELPELAAGGAGAAVAERVRGALRRMAFLNAPTAVGYLAFGLLVVGGLYRTGSFGAGDTWLVYAVLGGYALGLLAATSSRLLQNAFYALGAAATPSRVAVERVLLAATLALPLMFALDRVPVAALGGEAAGRRFFLGAAGLSLGSGVAAWYELARLARVLRSRLDGWRFPWRDLARPLARSAAAAAPAALLWWALPPWPPLATAAAVLAAYAAAYLALARLGGAPELGEWRAALRGR